MTDDGQAELDELVAKYSRQLITRKWNEVMAELEATQQRHAEVGKRLVISEARRRLEKESWDKVRRWLDKLDQVFVPDEAIRLLRNPVAEGDFVEQWRFVSPIGTGGFGEVWKIERERHQVRSFGAVKFLRVSDDETRRRFEREGRLLAELSRCSPFLCRYEDFGQWRDRWYIRMEWINGLPMTRFCAANRLTPAKRVELFLKVLRGVKAIHGKNVVHRDLKPGNILVSMSADEVADPKIIDFGSVKLTGVPETALSGGQITREFAPYTPHYASPEQIKGAAVTDWVKSDVYSLGVILHEILYGFRPWQWLEPVSESRCEELGRHLGDTDAWVSRDARMFSETPAAPHSWSRWPQPLSEHDVHRLADARAVVWSEYDALLRDTNLWEVVAHALHPNSAERCTTQWLQDSLEEWWHRSRTAVTDEALPQKSSIASPEIPDTQSVEASAPDLSALSQQEGSACPAPAQPTMTSDADFQEWERLRSIAEEADDYLRSIATDRWHLWGNDAAHGNTKSLVLMGFCLVAGLHGVPNVVEGLERLSTAVSRGEVCALFVLGHLHYHGTGVDMSKTKAADYFARAAESGHAGARHCLGAMHLHGDGIDFDKNKAITLFTLAASQGHASAQYHLGELFFTGDGVAKNRDRATDLFREAAQQGLILAQLNLLGKPDDWGYEELAYSRALLQDDKAEAFRLLTWAARQGLPDAQYRLAKMYDKGDHVRRDRDRAIELYAAAAVQDYDMARERLRDIATQDKGVGHLESVCGTDSVPISDRDARKWRRLRSVGQDADHHLRSIACKRWDAWEHDLADGNIMAALLIGICLLTSQDDSRFKSAIYLLRRANLRDDPSALHMLGHLHHHGTGPQTSKRKAIDFYYMASDRGHAGAQTSLGIMYYAGDGVTVDKAEAVRLLTKAAAHGFADAQNFLGEMYDDGDGVPLDKAKAIAFFTKAASQGHRWSQYHLARLYEDRADYDNTIASEQLFGRAAASGHARSNYCLARMYRRYYHNSGNRDYLSTAIGFYDEAARQGVTEAQYELGRIYDKGKGVPPDKEKALEFFAMAARQGHADACYRLGLMYERGDGVDADRRKALELYKIAEAGGVSDASQRLTDLLNTP